MANPICLSPLKFYDNLAKQNHRKSYAYGHISPLIMPLNTLDPFQIVLSGPTVRIIGVYLFSAKTDNKVNELNYISELLENGLTYTTIHGYNIVTYPGVFPVISIKAEGEYYLQLIANNGQEYYSEVFCFTNNLSDCLEIKYNNPEGYFFIKNGVLDLTNISFIIRLKSELGKPEYNFEEEATKRLGYSFIESQVSLKTYRFNTVIPEYICDALRIIRLCSNKTLYSRGDTHEMLTFDMNVEWQEQGDLASVTCEFQVDNIITNLGGYSAEKLGGDFNKDYNADFDNQ